VFANSIMASVATKSVASVAPVVPCGVTFVTALFDIGRERKGGDGSRFSDDLASFIKTLELKAQLVVFIPKDLTRQVKEKRAKQSLWKQKTHIVCQELHEIPCYKHLEAVRKVTDGGYAATVAGPSLVHRFPQYSILLFSKFGWLQEAMRLNPFDSKVFIWIDPCISRSVPQGFPSEPDDTWIRKINATHRVWVQGSRQLHKAMKKTKLPPDTEIFGQKLGWLDGGMFGGSTKCLRELCPRVIKLFETEMLAKNRVDTDEAALLILLRKHPDLFQVAIKRAPATIWSRICEPFNLPNPNTGALLAMLTQNQSPSNFRFKFHPPEP
jgi:hypothetical protein